MTDELDNDEAYDNKLDNYFGPPDGMVGQIGRALTPRTEVSTDPSVSPSTYRPSFSIPVLFALLAAILVLGALQVHRYCRRTKK